MGESGSAGVRTLTRLLLPAAVVAAACAALWRPAAGEWLSASGALDVMVPAVMFLISLRVDGSRLAAAVRHPLPLLASLALVYGLFPPIALAWHALFGPPGVDGRAAMMILAAQPSTLATAAVLTQMAGGNVALALVCTAGSQLVSAALTPLLVGAYLGAAVHVDVASLVRDLTLQILLPIAAAQGVRLLGRSWIDRRGVWLGAAAETVVVGFVLAGFSGARSVLVADPTVVAAAVGAVAAIHVTMLAASAVVGALFLRDGEDRIAFTLASSQKTLASGILVWRSAFPSNPIGPVFLVLYHLLQTAGGALLAPRMRDIRIGRRRPFAPAAPGSSSPA